MDLLVIAGVSLSGHLLVQLDVVHSDLVQTIHHDGIGFHLRFFRAFLLGGALQLRTFFQTSSSGVTLSTFLSLVVYEVFKEVSFIYLVAGVYFSPFILFGYLHFLQVQLEVDGFFST